MLPGYQAIAIPASLAYISNWPGENSFLRLHSKGILLARIGTASLFWHELMPGVLIVATDYVPNQFLLNILVTSTFNK